MSKSEMPNTLIISLSSDPNSKELVKDVYKYRKQKFPSELSEELFTIYLNENHTCLQPFPILGKSRSRAEKLFGSYYEHYRMFEENVLMSPHMSRCFVFCVDLDKDRIKDYKNLNVIGYGAILLPELSGNISMSVNIKKTHSSYSDRIYKFIARECQRQDLEPLYMSSERKPARGFKLYQNTDDDRFLYKIEDRL